MRTGASIGASAPAHGKGSLRGPELLTNGDFTQSGTGWTVGGAGITFAVGAVQFNTATNDQIGQSTAIVAGRRYEVSITITNYVRGNPQLNIGGAIVSGFAGANGTYKQRVIAGSVDNKCFFYGGTFGNGGQWDGSNFSIKECL